MYCTRVYVEGAQRNRIVPDCADIKRKRVRTIVTNCPCLRNFTCTYDRWLLPARLEKNTRVGTTDYYTLVPNHT